MLLIAPNKESPKFLTLGDYACYVMDGVKRYTAMLQGEVSDGQGTYESDLCVKVLATSVMILGNVPLEK